MAEGKKGFIMYADQKEIFEQLSDVKAGKLIKHIFKYVNDENPKSNDPFLNLAFTPIKTQLKRDLKHWETVRRVRSDAGKASAEARKKKKQKLTKSTNVKYVQQKSTNSTVIVKDKVKVIDIVNVIKNYGVGFEKELIDWVIMLQENHNRDVGQMQLESYLKLLDSWYISDQQRKDCLIQHVANNWKTLNYIDFKKDKEISYDIK